MLPLCKNAKSASLESSEHCVSILAFGIGNEPCLQKSSVDIVLYIISILSSAQTCQWKMLVWGGDPIQAINIQPLIHYIDLDTFVTNGEWELRATRAWGEVVFQGGKDFAYVLYEVTLRRRPSLLVLTVLLPVLVLALVNVFVFTIPSEAGGYSVNHSL